MSGSQSIEAAGFRRALSAFATGVTVVTTAGQDGEDIGLTANSFNSVSLDPPMILWSLAKSSLSLPAFREARHFAVHILGEDQEAVSGQFARRGEDKFAGVALERGPDNIPLLQNYAARFVCRTTYQYEGGDHIIFVGAVIEFDQREQAPLLFHGGQYGQIIKPEGSTGNPGATQPLQGGYLGDLLRGAYRRVYAPVRDELERRAITVPQYFFLSRIAQEEVATTARLKARLEDEGRFPPQEEIDALLSRGLVEREGEKFTLTADGVAFNLEVASVVKSAETDAEQALDYELRQTLKVALERLGNPG